MQKYVNTYFKTIAYKRKTKSLKHTYVEVSDYLNTESMLAI